MHVLLTNDDGILAPGLRTALKILTGSRSIRVSIAAPERERSAIGHAITLHKPLRVRDVDLDGVEAWSVSGTPADCTKLAVLALLDSKPDLVVSGINAGYNLASDVLYSGTVSAAIEGVMLGIPSVALSVSGRGGARELDRAASFLSELIGLLEKQGLEPDTLLNVNVPPPAGRAVPVELTRLGKPRYKDVFHRRVDPRGRTYFWMAGQSDPDLAEGTDLWAVDRGAISVTPLHFDLTDHACLERLPRWLSVRA